MDSIIFELSLRVRLVHISERREKESQVGQSEVKSESRSVMSNSLRPQVGSQRIGHH